MASWKALQFNNTRVWETQDRIGIWTIWRFIRRRLDLTITDWRRCKKKYRAEFENEELWNQTWKFWNKRRGQESKGKTAWTKNGQCSKGDNCSFRHDKDKFANSTQPNPSPRSSTQQNVKNASRTKSPGGRSPSGKMARLPCKDYLKGTCATPFCKNGILRSACATSPKMDINLWISALTRTARLTNSLANSLKGMVTKLQWLYWRIHDNWVAYFKICFKIWSRRSLQRFFGRAQTYWDGSNVFDSLKPCHVTLTFETKNRRLE